MFTNDVKGGKQTNHKIKEKIRVQSWLIFFFLKGISTL
jgi:hypothetical protein